MECLPQCQCTSPGSSDKILEGNLKPEKQQQQTMRLEGKVLQFLQFVILT